MSSTEMASDIDITSEKADGLSLLRCIWERRSTAPCILWHPVRVRPRTRCA
jgi:hypothetical protein